MAINQNHIAEELDGVKCSVVEKNVSKERAEFLKALLEYNRYTVVIAATPVAKPAAPKPAPKPAAAAPAVSEGEAPTVPVSPAIPAAPIVEEAPAPPPPPTSFTVGVTNLMFNPTNAVYGRALRTPDGHIVTPAYWQQKEEVSHDDVPYYQR